MLKINKTFINVYIMKYLELMEENDNQRLENKFWEESGVF